ncbi:MAG TPA: TetR/AcrR family transcriptional regulator, partial [Actinoallomurus sp.]
AFLEGSWQRRDLVRLLMDGDGPPGFELMRRTRNREWVRQNAVLLGAGTDPVDRVTVAVLTTVIGEAAREVAACEAKAEADTVAAAAIRLIRRLDPLSETDEQA